MKIKSTWCSPPLSSVLAIGAAQASDSARHEAQVD